MIMHILWAWKIFCRIVGIEPSGTVKKMKEQPAELTALYRELCYGDLRSAHRGKIRNVQFPAIRYFLYYLTRSVLPRENTSNISNFHLAFLAAALLEIGRASCRERV